MKNYIVCIDAEYIRDAQVYSGTENDACFDDFYLQDNWKDNDRNDMFLGVYEADSEPDAIRKAAHENGYDEFILNAYPVKHTKDASVDPDEFLEYLQAYAITEDDQKLIENIRYALDQYLDRPCEDCKYVDQHIPWNCKHPYKDACTNSVLWWPLESANN